MPVERCVLPPHRGDAGPVTTAMTPGRWAVSHRVVRGNRARRDGGALLARSVSSGMSVVRLVACLLGKSVLRMADAISQTTRHQAMQRVRYRRQQGIVLSSCALPAACAGSDITSTHS